MWKGPYGKQREGRRRTMPSAHLHGLATALPPYPLPQDLVQRRAQAILGPRYPQFDRLLKTFNTAGIDQRWSVAPIDWFEDPHTWRDRNAVFLEGATAMFIDAANRALDAAGWAPDEVDTVVSVTSTGIATPTLGARALVPMGFRSDILRVPLFGLGCAGGVSGLTTAAAMAVARPGTKVLLVVAEACTLSFRSDRLQKADIIATVLFGDGAAAACLSSDPTSVALGQGHQQTWPDTLAIMGWDVDDIGLGVVFDRAIPDFVTEHMAGATQAALAATGLRREEISRFVCHPGGAKVVDALEDTLELTQGSLNSEREVLRRAGNMSAPTVLFVLDDVLRSGQSGQMMATALGPGFTASFLPLKVAA